MSSRMVKTGSRKTNKQTNQKETIYKNLENFSTSTDQKSQVNVSPCLNNCAF